MPRLSAFYRTAFVTGASSGLGRAFADMLLAEGVLVWGTARDAARLKPLSENPGFTPICLDLDQPDAAVEMYLRTSESVGGFDLIVNNAGYGVFAPFHALKFDVWQRQLETMLIATARLNHAALNSMVQARRGCIVNIASLATDFPLPYMAGYNVAKAGLSALSESLMAETAGTGVTVIDFRPGDFRTEFNRAVQQLPEGVAKDARLLAVWQILERNVNHGPLPERAADGLRKALHRRRSGTVRCGSFFQAHLAPLLARFAPLGLRRSVAQRYFGGC